MALEFKDRVPQKPGRVKITPEVGSAFYAKLERADDPIQEGTPLNAGNLNAIQETLVYNNRSSVSTETQIFVAPNGDDRNSGTVPDKAMATIKGAIRKYAKCHKLIEIYLMDGTYNEDIGTIAVDQCSLSLHSRSEDKDAVVINLTSEVESHIQYLRLHNLTLNMISADTRPIVVSSGTLYAHNVRINVPETSEASCVNVYKGSSAWLMNCILNAGTGPGVYGDQALRIKAIDCISERQLVKGFEATNGTIIEYTPTLNAAQMTHEVTNGKCMLANTSGGTLGPLFGQHKSSDGTLIQWGVVTITPSAVTVPTTVTVTFPLPFADPPITVATPFSDAPEKLSVAVQRSGEFITDNTKQIAITLTRNGLTATGINWIAIGKGVTTE